MATADMDLTQGTHPIYRKQIRIVILGGNSVGKTSLIRRFIHNDVHSQCNDDIQDFYTVEMKDVDGAKHLLDIIDTTSDMPCHQVVKLTIQTGDAFLLLYAVDDRESYEKISGMREMILKQRKKDGKKVCIVVVGTKVDQDINMRTTPKEITEAVVTIDWQCGYMEISTKDKDAVDNVFREVLLRYQGHDGGSAASGIRRMTSPAEMFSKWKRRLTLKKHLSVI